MLDENLFLFILAGIWIIFASISDLKKREVPNWLSFSFIGFALAYRAFFALINSNLNYFLYGLFGLGIFVGLGYGFYYARVFAGGDAKLLFGLGAILPVSSSLISNFMIFGIFIFLLLFFGGLWGLVFSFYLAFFNKKKFSIEFRKQLKNNKKLIYYALVLSAISLILLFFDFIFIFIALLILLFPFLFIYAKSVENSCMIILVSSKELVEGDWLYENIKIKNKIIKPNWEGLSESEINLLRKSNKKIKVKQGIPFVPAFFFAFLALIIFYFKFDIFSFLY